MSARFLLLVQRHRALTASYFRRDRRGSHVEADRFNPAIDRVQRLIDRAFSASTEAR